MKSFRKALNLRAIEKRAINLRVLYLVLAIYILIVISRLFDARLFGNNTLLDSALLQLLLLIIPTVIYIKLMSEKKRYSLRLIAPSAEVLPVTFAATLAVICQSLLIGIVFGKLKAFSGSFTLYETFISTSDGSHAETVLIFVAYAILPALAEELIFRAIMCAECEQYGLICGVVSSSLFFAMIHFDLAKFPVYFFAGIMFALVRYATRSSMCAVIVHVLYNSFAIAFQSQIYSFYNNAGGPDLFVFLLTLLFLISLAAFFAFSSVLYRKYAERNYFPEHHANVSYKQSLSNLGRILLSYPAIACILIFLVMVIVGVIVG